MKSLKMFLVAITLGIMVVLAGCNTQKPSTAVPETSTQTTVDKNQPLSIEEGSKNMRTVLSDMKAELSNKEEDKAIQTSDQLEENWSKFEDEVKGKNLPLYEKLEAPLGTIQAAVKVKPLDMKVLTDSMQKLDSVLIEMQSIK